MGRDLDREGLLMDWKVSWINKQDEPTYIGVTLLLDGPVSERIDKVYKKPVELTPEFLQAQAQLEVERIEQELAPVPAPIIEEIV